MLESLNRLGLLGEFDISSVSGSVGKGLSRVPEAAHRRSWGTMPARSRRMGG